jgi:hypothetical protein
LFNAQVLPQKYEVPNTLPPMHIPMLQYQKDVPLCLHVQPFAKKKNSTNKTDHHDITEILLKVALNTIKQTNNLYSIMAT